jgi:hypothetical protein
VVRGIHDLPKECGSERRKRFRIFCDVKSKILGIRDELEPA